MSALLQVRDLQRAPLRRRWCCKSMSLDVRAGEVLALVGPNGAGKTTLLLALAQLLGRQEGEIAFRGPIR